MRRFALLLVLTLVAVPLFANETLRLVGTASAPPVVTRVNPVFPPVARQAKMHGLVKLVVLVDANGKVADVKVAEGEWAPLNDSAVTAVSAWTFQPTVIDGRPVPVLIDVNVAFSLR